MLDRVQAARDAGDSASALKGALEVWRATRAAVAADVVDALTTESNFQPPEPPRTNAAFQATWLSLLDEPRAGGWLAETLFARLPGKDGDARLEAFHERLKAAQAHPDPRLARALMVLVEQAPPIVSWASDMVMATLAVIGDARTIAALERYAPTANDKMGPKWRALIMKVPGGEPLPEAERWAKLLAPKKSADPEALFRVVLSSPDDDGPLAVWADCLQELGDPRGEFVALQLAEAAGQADLASRKRADAILKKHKKAWLGELARITYRAQFRRGVLDELELDGAWKAPRETWIELASSPLLATVRKLDGKPTDDLLAEFVSRMPGLREVRVEAEAMADAIDRSTFRDLRSLRSCTWLRRDHAQRFGARVIPILERIPTIDTVICTHEVLDAVLASRACSRMRHVTLTNVRPEHAFERFARLAHVTTLSFGYQSSTELRRDGDGLALRHEVHWPDALPELAHALPATVKRVELVSSKKLDTSPFGKREVIVREPAYVSGKATGLSS